MVCPFCKNITSNKELKDQFNSGLPKKRIIAVFENSNEGKLYRVPRENEIGIEEGLSRENELHENITQNDSRSLWLTIWGVDTWGKMYSNRQLYFLNALAKKIRNPKALKRIKGSEEYQKAIITYLSIWFNRIAAINNSFCRWDVTRENNQSPFSRQGIAMTFDFPEVNPFSQKSGGALNMLLWITRYLDSESKNSFSSIFHNASSGEKNQFEENSLDITVTDPPYYDAIGYADISDFFYVWMKRILGETYPLNFAFPLTPKSEECTALKHHHNGNFKEAKEHFENKLQSIFSSIEYQTKDIVSIMFAHQSTEAWTTLCNSILRSKMNINGSWAIDTELSNRTVGLAGDALGSSVTVSCSPSSKSGFGDYKEVQKEILEVIKKEVGELYALGFRGADLLTACFGKAVSVFGRYETVEKSDGSEVMVAELLEMAKEAAFNAIISDIDTDDISKFYIGWLNLFGFSEAVHDDVRRITQIGLNLDIDDIYNQNILFKIKDRGKLSTMEERILVDKRLGLRPVNNATIDIAHRMLYLWKQGNRGDLLQYIADKAPKTESPVWRVLNSLKELLPVSKDQQYVTEILSNQDNLVKESKNRTASIGNQITLDLDNN